MSLDDYADYKVSQDGMNSMSTIDPGHGTRLSMYFGASRYCESISTDEFSMNQEYALHYKLDGSDFSRLVSLLCS